MGWNDGNWLFPRAVQLLDIERYRDQVLAGIVLSASTKTDSTVRKFTLIVGFVAVFLECTLTKSIATPCNLRSGELGIEDTCFDGRARPI